jgi:branched-chain amino acid transport system ATP-binding protein
LGEISNNLVGDKSSALLSPLILTWRDAMLETVSISKSFGKLNALVDVSFSVEEGEVFGIAGPNGAGKSTLFNVITGNYKPTSGKVFFKGRDITPFGPDRVCHAGIGRTYQIPATFQSLSVQDNIRVGATFGGKKTRPVEEIIDFLKLSEIAHQPAKNLDLFSTKLVMLGSVLATDCELLMLDEPMAGFSVSEIDKFIDVVRSVNKKWGLTVIIIEHLIDILISITGRTLILDNGSLLYLGSSSGVTEDRRVIEVYLGSESKGGEDA